MQTKQPQPNECRTALCEELESVIDLVLAHAKGKEPTPTLALTRLVNGLTYKEWEQLVADYSLSRWIAFPLDTNSAEAAEAIISLQNNLIFQRDHDALTGIKNRGCFDRIIAREFDRAKKTNSELSLIIIDIDDFKKVNDTYGHSIGDKVLQRLAAILAENIASYDTVARIGGEEFAILLPATSCWTAQRQCTAILDIFRRERFEGKTNSFNVTFSAGVSSLAIIDPPVSKESLFTTSDEALYSVKRNGKNAVAVAATSKMSRDQNTLVHMHEKKLLFSSDDME